MSQKGSPFLSCLSGGGQAKKQDWQGRVHLAKGPLDQTAGFSLPRLCHFSAGEPLVGHSGLLEAQIPLL